MNIKANKLKINTVFTLILSTAMTFFAFHVHAAGPLQQDGADLFFGQLCRQLLVGTQLHKDVTDSMLGPQTPSKPANVKMLDSLKAQIANVISPDIEFSGTKLELVLPKTLFNKESLDSTLKDLLEFYDKGITVRDLKEQLNSSAFLAHEIVDEETQFRVSVFSTATDKQLKALKPLRGKNGIEVVKEILKQIKEFMPVKLADIVYDLKILQSIEAAKTPHDLLKIALQHRTLSQKAQLEFDKKMETMPVDGKILEVGLDVLKFDEHFPLSVQLFLMAFATNQVQTRHTNDNQTVYLFPLRTVEGINPIGTVAVTMRRDQHGDVYPEVAFIINNPQERVYQNSDSSKKVSLDDLSQQWQREGYLQYIPGSTPIVAMSDAKVMRAFLSFALYNSQDLLQIEHR